MTREEFDNLKVGDIIISAAWYPLTFYRIEEKTQSSLIYSVKLSPESEWNIVRFFDKSTCHSYWESDRVLNELEKELYL